jgi:hypothetical protein
MYARLAALFVLASALAITSCTSSSSSVTAPSAQKCQVGIANPTAASFSAGGGNGSLTVTATRDCTWSAAVDASWVALSKSTGQGEADVPFSVSPNPAALARSASITIGSDKKAVNQAAAPCTFDLSRTSDRVAATGGRLSVDVRSLAGCAWTATSSVGWIAVESGQRGNGSGTVVLAASVNAGAERTGQVTIAGRAYTVTQDPVAETPAPTPSPVPPTPTPPAPPSPQPAPCSPSVSPTSGSIDADGGELTFGVSAARACTWTAVSNAAWIAVSGGSAGTGSGQVRLLIAANLSSSRTGTVKVGDATYTVSQEGQPPAPTPVQISGSISSIAGRCPNLTFRVHETDVVTNSSTRYSGGSCSDLKNKKRVTVTGLKDAAGTVHATRIEIGG